MSKRFHVDLNERVDVFEFDASEVISETPPNVITIRARMDVATAGKVSSELLQLGSDNKIESHLGAHIGALLLHNILGWRGPDFDDLPCTPANIRALPSAESDPFIQKVADAISARNRKRESPNGKPRTAPGFATNGSADVSPASAGAISLQLATGAERSNSPSGLLGHLRKSESSTPTS